MRLCGAFAAAGVMLLAAAPAGAKDTADVRFVHAVPGVGEADLTVDGEDVGVADFGDITDSASVPAGSVDLELTPPEGDAVSAPEELDAGESYTIVAALEGETVELRVYRDGDAEEGTARLRMIHASPELGEPDLRVGDDVVAEAVAYGDATSYESLKPGTYDVAAEDPETGDAVVSDEVAVSAGTTSTAVVVGSRGEPARLVLVDDATAAPSSAPEAGFGALSDDTAPPWALALLAAVAAGALGGGAFVATGRLRRRGSGA